MISRRAFFGRAAAMAAAVSLLPEELIVQPKRTIFLPPNGGWAQSDYGRWCYQGKGQYIALGGGHQCESWSESWSLIQVYSGATLVPTEITG